MILKSLSKYDYLHLTISVIMRIVYRIRGVKRITDSTSTLDVLKEEIKEIDKANVSSEFDNDAFTRLAHSHYPRTALCLSGGGIRSAAFALGVVQWLNKNNLLNQFQYLSTVSGGGYIGAWLSAWIHNEPAGFSDVSKNLMRAPNSTYEPSEIRRLRENSQFITPRSGALSGDTWSAIAITLRNLFLNWLVIVPFIAALCVSPQIMALFFSKAAAEHWGTIAIIIAAFLYFVSVTYTTMSRANWRIVDLGRGQFFFYCFIPGFLAALSWSAYITSLGAYKPKNPQELMLPLVGNFISFSPETNEIINQMLLYGIIAMLIHFGAWIVTGISYIVRRRIKPHITVKGRSVVLMWSDEVPQKSYLAIPYEFTLSRTSQNVISAFVRTEDRQAVNGIHYYGFEYQEVRIAAGERKFTLYVRLIENEINRVAIDKNDLKIKIIRANAAIDYSDQMSTAIRDFLATVFSGFMVGCCFGLIDFYSHRWVSPGIFHDYCRVDGNTAALQLFPTDISQLNSFTVKFAWVLLIFTCLLPPLSIVSTLIGELSFVAATSLLPRSDDDREWLGRSSGVFLMAAIAWLILTSVTLVMPAVLSLTHAGLGLTRNLVILFTSVGLISGIVTAMLGTGSKTSASDRADSPWRRNILYAATGLFLVCLSGTLTIAVDIVVLKRLFFSILGSKEHLNDHFYRLCMAVIILCASAAAVGCFVNVNRFSLHAMYRNRLVRTFLGASNRRPFARNKFTWFNERDNIEMHRLWQRNSELAKGDKWRPYHVINVALNVVAGRNLAWQERKAESFVFTPMYCGAADLNAFRRSSEYAGRDKAITLGTAMAISGAAVSPNMGYNSSPIVTFLLTLFNVRLGWWFGNPKNNYTYLNEGPRFAIKPLLSEALGMTTDTAPYVYLSDGGHFENLGLYEMVRRRCHLIIVSDAGHDPHCGLEDLANATRKIYIDFGIPIYFPELNILRKRNGDWQFPENGGPGFTVGTIDYAAVDKDGARPGIILYVKPTVRGDEPADVLGYAASNAEFPHDSTADQWFKEAKFESYRALGFETMLRAHLAAAAADGSARLHGFENLKNFLSALQSRTQKNS